MRRIFTILFAACLTLGAWAAITKPLPSLHVEGKWLVDTYGNHVVLHGCMDTPSMWFNGNRWSGGYNATGAKNCLEYFEKLFTGLEAANCDIFRLHLDPAWTNDNSVTYVDLKSQPEHKDGKIPEGEANVQHFSSARLKTYLKSLYIPLMMKALKHGMYVIVRPPGVCPGEIRVDGYYQKYLLEVWDIVSKDETIRNYPGHIGIELANEPIGVKEANGSESSSTLYNFFQPIVDKIRQNGFKGIVWIPGTGYQSNYRSYGTKPIKDQLKNIGYAVHDYPGWYSCGDEDVDRYGLSTAKQRNYDAFLAAVPVVTQYPIIITEVDWSPLKEPKEIDHYNEMGQPTYKNLGTWATASTSKWGLCFKNLLDKFQNISMTLTHPHDYLDLDALMKDPQHPVPAFNGNPEACSGACWEWYAEYAKVDRPVADYVNLAPGSDLGNGKFMNPVVRADFPDPDVIRVDDTYYMVSTTMSLFPGATVLKSKDMVNWEYCCQPLAQLTATDEAYQLKNNKDAYASGMWAPSMKYYNGKFYILINEKRPIDGWNLQGWLLTTDNPEGTWTAKKLPRSYYDPGMLFDNGKVYVAQGIGNISVCELDENFNFKQEKTVITDRDGLEGSHFYKRGKYYYIYATNGGWPSGQSVFRSENPFGPYEEKVLVEKYIDGKPNTIHQGALIEDVKGKWWTIMQEDLGSLGRFPNLQPVTWVNDWPVIGNNGKPYRSFVDEIAKPATSLDEPWYNRMPTTDNFRSYPLGMQWEWNHAPDNSAWSLFERAGWLRLKSNTVVSSLPQARNMLTQRIYIDKDKVSTGTIRVDVSRMQEGDRAGITIFQDPFAAIALEVKNGNRQIVWWQDKVKDAGSGFTASQKTQAVTLTDNIVYLRAAVQYGDNKAMFYYSTDGTNWKKLGGDTSQSFNLSVFFGARFGLFFYSTQTAGGSADFDWFSTESTYNEEELYGPVNAVLDEKMFTVKKIVPAKSTVETIVGGANSPGVTATFLDNHTENVSTLAVYEPQDEGVVEFRNGQMSGLTQGSTRVLVSYTDAFGNQADTAFTARVSYFPLDEQYISTALAGKTGTYKRYNNYGKFTFAGTDNQMGWNYDNYTSKGVNFTDYKYLVVRLYYANTSAKASINFYASKTSMSGGCSVPLSSSKETVIDLQNLKYTFGANKDKKFTPSAIHKVTFSSASTSTSPNICVTEMILTNDDPTGINELEWQQAVQGQTVVNVYSLSGRLVRRAVNRNDALRGLPAGLYLVDGQKYVVK